MTSKQEPTTDELTPQVLCIAMLVIGIGYGWFLFAPESVSLHVTAIFLISGLGIGIVGVLRRNASNDQ